MGRIDELRRFRHAFCNLYQTELDPARVRDLEAKVPRLAQDFLPFHGRFIAVLDLLAQTIGEP